MKRRTMTCPICDRDISLTNYDRHVKTCTGVRVFDTLDRDSDGKCVCPECGKSYTTKGIGTHMWRMHGIGKDHNPNTGYGDGSRKAWNKDVLTYDEIFYSDYSLVKEYLIEYGDVHSESTIRKHMKLHLITIHGNTCSVCGTEEWFGDDVPLVCDHIDGNSENHDYDNFRLVCGNCDMLLPTYKSKNRGNGRKERRNNKYFI